LRHTRVCWPVAGFVAIVGSAAYVGVVDPATYVVPTGRTSRKLRLYPGTAVASADGLAAVSGQAAGAPATTVTGPDLPNVMPAAAVGRSRPRSSLEAPTRRSGRTSRKTTDGGEQHEQDSQ